MPEFENRDGKLYVGDSRYNIEPKEVLCGFESYSGWFWFATEEAYKQDSVIDGRIVKDDTIYFGLTQGFEEEWGYFSKAELESLSPKIWKIKDQDLPYAGRRERN
jgi:hypothetical protein